MRDGAAAAGVMWSMLGREGAEVREDVALLTDADETLL